VTIRYAATPKQGMYFRTPELGYRALDMHVFTQGESIESRHWFPCFDAPNEKFTSEVTCRVPEGMVVLLNGRLVSEEKDPATGLIATRWRQEQPHSSYLIALAAGYFKKVDDRYHEIPLAFYVPASEAGQAANSFAGTKDMMAFFEHEIGLPYPWAKYHQVCVEDFVAGGMENTSLTILNANTLHTSEFENLRESQGLVAHELAHQWFGDYVTCKDWANVWLNEGFATYYEKLYAGHRFGRDELRYRLYESAKGITAHAGETNAIVRRDFNRPDDQFSYLAYPKGAWVLHMLRSQLGDDLFRRCIKTYLDRHAFGTVVTEDLNRVIEELSGHSFDRFFDQWVFHAAQPELAVEYSWDERAKLAKLHLVQTQPVNDRVMLFQFPLPVRFKTQAGAFDRQVWVKESTEDFYFALPAAPEIVRIDPELTVLAKINFNPPRAMLDAQRSDPSDMLGRLLAIEKLSGKSEAVSALKEALNQDSFYGVRLAAARGLLAIRTEEALDALIASAKQPDARVRRQVITGLAGFYQDKAYAALLELARQERNPDIRATVIRGLGAYAKPEARATLLEALKSKSYHHVLAEAAMAAMRNQDDPAYIPAMLEFLQQQPEVVSTRAFTGGLRALAWLSRNESPKDAVREFLLSHLNNKRYRVKNATIEALGTLGDPKAIGPLETLVGESPESRESDTVEKAVSSLRDARKPSVELGSLRSEVMNLKKDQRALRQEIDDLKKRIETTTNPPPVASDKPATKGAKPAKPLPKARLPK
jgi:aminopeptidase N